MCDKNQDNKTIDVTESKKSDFVIGQSSSKSSSANVHVESSAKVVQRQFGTDTDYHHPTQGRVGVSCPGCNTNFEYLSVVEVAWEPSEKSYYLRARFDGACAMRYETDTLELGKIALDIAATSHCSCGGPLDLAEHWMRCNGGEWEFNEFFVCARCSNRHRSAKTLGSRIMDLFSHVKRISVGSKGIELEKREPPQSWRDVFKRIMEQRFGRP